MSDELKDRLEAIGRDRAEMEAEVQAHLNAAIDRLCAEKGISREDFIDFAQRYLADPRAYRSPAA